MFDSLQIMNWFLIALITPLAHAAVNHIDKYLIQKYLRGSNVGSLVLFSALFAVIALPVVYWMDPTVFNVSTYDAVLLIINGALLVLAYICYFYALSQDEASLVVPLFQFVPIFGFILGYFILGETLSKTQLLGSIIIIFGAILLSLRLGNNRVHIKKSVLWLMTGSSLCYAINGVLFKFITETQQRFLPSLFWDFTGKVLFGLLLFATVTSYRRQFLVVLKENKASILSLNALNELLALAGESASVFAVLLAPVVLVQVIGGFQPLFVFIYGVLLTLLFPWLSKESLAKKDLFQKIVGIGIVTIGTIVLNV